MKKIIKNILISLVAIIVLACTGYTAYGLGWKKIENNLLQKGFNIAVGQIVNSVQQTGQVQISQDLILIKQ